MNHDKWNEKNIEKILSNAPKIIDQRSKEEVFQRLKNEGLFNDKPSKSHKRKLNTWIPYLISVAAIIICAILIPSILNNMKNDDHIASKSSINRNVKLQEDYNTMMLADKESIAPLKSAFYEEDLNENIFFKIGLVSEAADSVPVTVVISKEQIQEDFGMINPTPLQIYNEYSKKIDEEKWGFIDYHPYSGKITEEGTKLIYYLPRSQNYDISSASYTTFESSLIDTFSAYYYEIEFRNEDGTPLIFNEVGEEKPLVLNSELTQYNYFRFTQNDGTQFLVPNFRASFQTVEEALDAMKVEINDIYESVILPDVDYSVHTDENTVIVQFHSEVNLLDYEQKEAMQMIEGMLLTAASFNKEVQFENVSPKNWQGFDFTKPLPKPIGPNKISLSDLIQ